MFFCAVWIDGKVKAKATYVGVLSTGHAERTLNYYY